MQSKANAERYVEKSGMGYTILRLPPVIGPNDTFLTPAIIPRILNGKLYSGGKKDPLFSTLYVRNLGPIVAAIIQKGPTNTSYNSSDYLIKWGDFVSEYGRALGISVPFQRKSPLKTFILRKDMQELLIMGYSTFGAGYPNNKLVQAIGLENVNRFKWQDGVHEAVDTFFKQHPEYKDPRNNVP
jgi:nucleoside-diphosphate-sugar epimerase